MTITHSGYVAIVGRPNVGKSTLLNNLLQEKVSITSPKPQTTRAQILGIQTLPDAQIVYIDTPGIHRTEKRAINRYMNKMATSVLQDADVIIFVVNATVWRSEDQLVLAQLQKVDRPVILALNKIDLVKDKNALLPIIAKLSTKLNFSHVIPISALKGEHIQSLEAEIVKLLPPGEIIFPEDQLTDKSMRFQVAEIIREKIIYATEEELPYATTVEIETYRTVEALTEIAATIWVERRGQKIIILGKGGAGLKKIGIAARHDIEKLVGTKVFLRLWVKVKENWTDDSRALKHLGYE
ncbi:MAG TPA: GTPase Era [Gammaproteobacteria bacterium]|jgi:GTP-binding protein Era|nr:GTPase Era [Gammaproteobacteria bacterium]